MYAIRSYYAFTEQSPDHRLQGRAGDTDRDDGRRDEARPHGARVQAEDPQVARGASGHLDLV